MPGSLLIDELPDPPPPPLEILLAMSVAWLLGTPMPRQRAIRSLVTAVVMSVPRIANQHSTVVANGLRDTRDLTIRRVGGTVDGIGAGRAQQQPGAKSKPR